MQLSNSGGVFVGTVSLARAATSIIFVATKVLCLSRQSTSFVATKVYLLRPNYVFLSPFSQSPFSPSLRSLMVSVDVKHHIYLLTYSAVTVYFTETEHQARQNNIVIIIDYLWRPISSEPRALTKT